MNSTNSTTNSSAEWHSIGSSYWLGWKASIQCKYTGFHVYTFHILLYSVDSTILSLLKSNHIGDRKTAKPRYHQSEWYCTNVRYYPRITQHLIRASSGRSFSVCCAIEYFCVVCVCVCCFTRLCDVCWLTNLFTAHGLCTPSRFTKHEHTQPHIAHYTTIHVCARRRRRVCTHAIKRKNHARKLNWKVSVAKTPRIRQQLNLARSAMWTPTRQIRHWRDEQRTPFASHIHTHPHTIVDTHMNAITHMHAITHNRHRSWDSLL